MMLPQVTVVPALLIGPENINAKYSFPSLLFLILRFVNPSNGLETTPLDKDANPTLMPTSIDSCLSLNLQNFSCATSKLIISATLQSNFPYFPSSSSILCTTPEPFIWGATVLINPSTLSAIFLDRKSTRLNS